jgi:hypothetical protein
MEELVGRVSPVHIESEETTVLATRAAVEVLESHFVEIEKAQLSLRKSVMSWVTAAKGGRPKETM